MLLLVVFVSLFGVLKVFLFQIIRRGVLSSAHLTQYIVLAYERLIDSLRCILRLVPTLADVVDETVSVVAERAGVLVVSIMRVENC